MRKRRTALDRAAQEIIGGNSYQEVRFGLVQARQSIHQATWGMDEDGAAYAKAMQAATSIAEILDALRDAEQRNERENEYLRAALGRA